MRNIYKTCQDISNILAENRITFGEIMLMHYMVDYVERNDDIDISIQDLEKLHAIAWWDAYLKVDFAVDLFYVAEAIFTYWKTSDLSVDEFNDNFNIDTFETYYEKITGWGEF